ncbi:hypothetical protein [Aestuariivirga sp.]|jgi:hypothetical protein|uniref:hypothetical protein n=1 Tax=Aestuariivirga sp. TaxID=2650926 RepID=UPI003783E31B
MRIFFGLLAFAALFSVILKPSLAEDDLPIDVALGETEIHVQSKVDNVTIDSVTVNRGNCWIYPIYFSMKLPHALRFGETLILIIDPNCNPIEIDVETDLGQFTFTD